MITPRMDLCGALMSENIEWLKSRIARNRAKLAVLSSVKSSDISVRSETERHIVLLQRLLAIQERLLSSLTSDRPDPPP